MVWCTNCLRDRPGVRDNDGVSSCDACGKVFQYDNYSTEVTFVKDSAGQSMAAGRRVRSIEVENFSRQRLYDRVYDELTYMKNGLEMGDNQAIVDEALTYYKIAVERNFTKGRRTEQVQAACLYIACRENRRPYLLIDFSNYLSINIYVLGAVFLQLCKVLNLTEHPICQKLLDPSIFIHKYTANLTGGRNKEIADGALNIIASMNRDWMQTGRRPSGLWGAALYISALSNGEKCSRSDILRLVHVCEATLSKRLVEFENTESGGLTIEELNAKADELKESSTQQSDFGFKASGSKELLCQHKGTTRPPLAYGLCKDCYGYFIGFDGGSDPPAFQRAEKQRREKSSTMEEDDSHLYEEELNNACMSKDERLQQSHLKTSGSPPMHLPIDGAVHGEDDITANESDNFSDIDDAEVDSYLHNEEEKHLKKIIWEEMNREYLEEQKAKEAAAAAAKNNWEANMGNCSEEFQAARELNAAVAASVAKKRKQKQEQRAAEVRNKGPAQSPQEALHRILTKKRLGSKVNYDVLEMLFEDPGANDTKKIRTESESNDEKSGITQNVDKNETIEPDSEYKDREDTGGEDDNYIHDDEGEDKYTHYGGEENYMHEENIEEEINFTEDYDYL